MVLQRYLPYLVFFLTLILALLLAACSAQPPQVLDNPNVQTFGAFSGELCYSDSVSVKSIVRVTTRSFTFIPKTPLTYIVCYNNVPLHPFEAMIVGGGVGTKLPSSIVVTSYTGRLIANCDAYCEIIT